MQKENTKSGRRNLAKRIGMSFFGVIVCAISVGIFKIAALGVDPFQSFMAGLDFMIPLDFGLLYIIVNVLLLSFALIFDRHYIGIATFINLFLLGYITQFTYGFLQTILPNPSMLVRVICLVVGVVIICFGSAFYMGPLIEFFNVHIARPFLAEKKSTGS